jgi:hypothetical protein
VLDASRSAGSLQPHLAGMGMSELAQTAGESVVPAYAYEWTDKAVRVRCVSSCGARERTLPLDGAPVCEAGRDGAALRLSVRAAAAAAPWRLAVVADWAGRGRISDDRVLTEDAAAPGGLLLTQTLEFAHAHRGGRGGGATTASTRYFVRADAPPLSGAAASSAAAAAKAAARGGRAAAAAAAAAGGGDDADGGDGGGGGDGDGDDGDAGAGAAPPAKKARKEAPTKAPKKPRAKKA